MIIKIVYFWRFLRIIGRFFAKLG